MTAHDQPIAEQWQMQFTSNAKCVALVRKQVGKALKSWGYGTDSIDRTLLVCSELATNAVQHGHRPGYLFEVRMITAGTTCLVEVSDTSPVPPRPLSAGVDDEHGRGLQLVAALAEETGHHSRHPLGKTVWARLLLDAPKEEPDA
uniref:ATP-binding protein n=1 Tax=Streptomyces sp. NBC_00003 TaxID=2903608 RepID=A0AAU2V252_9ACTN